MLTPVASVCNACLQEVVAAVGAADPTPGRLLVYGGSAPATPGGAITDQSLLIEFLCALPCGTIADGKLAFAATVVGNISAVPGIATWGRILDGAGNWVADFDVGESASGAWLELTRTNAFQNGIFTLSDTAITLSLSGTGDLNFEINPVTGNIQPKAVWSISPEYIPEFVCTAVGTAGDRGILAASIAVSLTCSALGEWDPNVSRGPGGQCGSPFREGTPSTVEWRSEWRLSTSEKPEICEAFNSGTPLPSETRSLNGALVRCHVSSKDTWQPGTPAQCLTRSGYVHAYRRHDARCVPWQASTPAQSQYTAPFVHCWRRHRAYYAPWRETTSLHLPPAIIPWKIPRRWKRGTPQYYIPWQGAGRPPWIWPIPEEPIPEPVVLFQGDPDLNLTQGLPDWKACIVFDLALAARYAARPCYSGIRRYIIVIPELSLKLTDGTVIPCESIEISTDIDSWTWALKAGFKGYAPDPLINASKVLASSLTDAQKAMPWYDVSNVDSSGYIWVPTEVIATVQGSVWKFVLEGYDQSRQHGSIQSNVSGRSLSAYLAAPYMTLRSRIESTERTANQCAEDELYGYGWTLAWDTVDWLISAGALSYESESPMSALKLIADSVGAVLQTHPSSQQITILPKYPVSSWALASTAADITIPEDIIQQLSHQWVAQKIYRGVWVAGKDQGVLVRVMRDGTDGDPWREMVVNPLITHVDAGREAGRNILSAMGRRANVSLVMPLLADPGLILPGKIVLVDQASAWKGYVTGTLVSGRHGSVTQTVEIERIYETP